MNEYQVSRFLPPLKPLRAFTLVASTNSFTETGKQMHLSQSAVSHQIKQLEEYLGVKLFERKPNRLVLTEAGKHYAELVHQALEILTDATTEVVKYPQYTHLRLQAPAILFSWLRQHLDQFKALHPYIKVHFQQVGDMLVSGNPVDITITHKNCNRLQNDSTQVASEPFKLTLAMDSECKLEDWYLVYLHERASEKNIKNFREWLFKKISFYAPQSQEELV